MRISLKLDDSVFGETEKILSDISIPRNRYINEAIKFYEPTQTELIVIGEWGARYMQGVGYQFEKFPGITKEKRQEDALKINKNLSTLNENLK